MKAITHYVFSIGFCLYAYSLAGSYPQHTLILVGLVAVAVNWVIDGLGHRTRGGVPTRTWLTHSVFTARLWGVLVGAAIGSLPAWLLGLFPGLPLVYFLSGMGVLVAFGHLFLDSLTQGGVYYMRRRIALAHFSYNNPIVNGAFVLLGLFLIAAAFSGVPLTLTPLLIRLKMGI